MSRPTPASSASPPPRHRVLVLRSCRMAQFERAVGLVREWHPDAEIWALTGADFRDAVMQAGLARVVPCPPGRMSVLRLLPVLVRLRRYHFDTVVVPLMTPALWSGSNLFRVAARIRASEYVIVPGTEPVRVYGARALRRLAVRTSLLSVPDAPLTLLLLFLAALRPRRRKPRPPGARRRVLHVINSLGIGGAQTQCVELLNRLSPSEFEVDVLVFARDSEFSRSRLVRSDVRIEFLDPSISLHSQIVLAVAERCRQRDYDIVHTWLFMANVLASAGARLAGVPCIVTSVRSLNPSNYPQYLQWWHRAADVLAARIADAVTVNATALVGDHARWALIPRRRVTVIHNGIDPTQLPSDRASTSRWLRHELGIPTTAHAVGIVGRLSVEKDHESFLRAMGHLAARGRDVYGVVVGDGPLRADLHSLARATPQLASRIRFLGARGDSHRIMAGLDLLAITSTIEGFPNVLIEAGLIGVPVVASDVGGVVEVLGSTDDTFAARDVDAAARAIAAALDAPRSTAARAETRRVRCLTYFTADRMHARWMSVYANPRSRRSVAVPHLEADSGSVLKRPSSLAA